MKKSVLILITMLVMSFATMAQNGEEENENLASYYTVDYVKHKEDSTSEYKEGEVSDFIKIKDRVFNAGGIKYILKRNITEMIEVETDFDTAMLAEHMKTESEVFVLVNYRDESTVFEIYYLDNGADIYLVAKKVQ
jgi:hypothetical protein